MGHLNVGKPTLSSGLGIFWSVVSRQFQVAPSGLFSLSSCTLVPSGSQQVNIPLSRDCTLQMPVGHGRTKSD